MARRGRNPVLDKDQKEVVCGLLVIGCSRHTAARYVGCAPDAIRRAALRDPAFFRQLRQAEARVEVTHLRNLHEAAEKNWRVSTWALERLLPNRFASRRPGTLTTEQVAQVIGQFARIIAEEVPVPEYRRAILGRLKEINQNLKRARRASRPQRP